MPKNYQVAVIGRTGKGNYGHGLDTVWKEFDNVEIVAVADEDEKGRGDAVKRLGAKIGYADYRMMLEKERPHIVSVADRWLDAHKDMVIACARSGASVFMEKPMCPSLADADEMIKACEMHHVKLAIAHQTRYSPRLQRVKEMIADGRLGSILEMRGRGKEDQRGGGEDLMVLGTHIMDLMRLLAGDAQSCLSRVSVNGKPATKDDIGTKNPEGMGPILGDQISATYTFDKGAMGFFGTHKAKEGAGTRFGLTVYGTRGVVQLTTGDLPAVWFLDDPSWFPGKSKAAWKEVTSAGVDKPEPLASKSGMGNVWIVKDLMDAIENDRQPLGSMYDGRAALEMILAVYESHRLKGVVELPLKNRKHPLTML
jgi:predicted dehydrogenase